MIYEQDEVENFTQIVYLMVLKDIQYIVLYVSLKKKRTTLKSIYK